jgi:hypothetical protein
MVEKPYCSPCGCGCCPFEENSGFTALAVADANSQRLRVCGYPSGTATGSCVAGGRVRADSRFDVTFTCPPGTPSPIPVALNFHVKGGGSVFEQNLPPGAGANLRLHVAAGPVGFGGFGVPSAGEWYPEDGTAGPSTGVFAALPESNAILGDFTAPTSNVDIDGSGNGTHEVALISDVQALLNTGTAQAEMMFAGSAIPNGVFLPVGSPVFQLPKGCTCNSVDAEIVNNYIGGPTSVEEPQGENWGSIKSMYR